MDRAVCAGYCMAMLLATLLSGCGNAGAGTEGNASSSVPENRQDIVYDLMEERWALERYDAEASLWNAIDCIEVTLPDSQRADYSYYFSAVENSHYYVLQDLLTEQEGYLRHTLYFTDTDVADGDSAMAQWTLAAAHGEDGEVAIESLLEAFEDNRAWITGMDVAAGKVYLFIQQSETQEQNTIHYYRIEVDLEGKITGLLDLLPAIQEGDAVPEDNMQLSGGQCDGTGRCYVSDSTMSRICIIDGDGQLLTVIEKPENSGEALTYMGKLPDGRPLYACMDAGEQSLRILGYDGQKAKELYRGKYELLQNCLIRPDGSLIYGKGGKMLRWNVLSGACENLYDDKQLSFASCDGILEGADGKLFAAFMQTDGTFLYGFTAQETEQVVIQLEMLSRGDEYIETCASEYSRRHPGIRIEVTQPEEDTDLQLTRTLARLSQGEGPDLLLVSRQQLQSLQKEGVLAELSEVLPAGEQEQIFPGVLDNGRIGRGLYGITCSTTLATLMVSDRIWEGRSWTLEDVIKLLKEQTGVEHFSDHDGWWSGMILYDLVLANISHSSLIDMQAGKCYFDTEEFVQVLELCRKYEQAAQNSPQMTEEAAVEQCREGKMLVYTLEGNLSQFSRAMALLGEDFHSVGYPAREGSGNLLKSYYGCVAVSATADHREIIDDFLRFLVSYKAQQQYGLNWVRKDVLSDSVEEHVEVYGSSNLEPVFRQGNRSVISLAGKPDGSSYLPEFLETMNNSIPYESELDIIRNIVREEAGAYFAGDRSAAEVAEIIQKRVQIYLDEQSG